MACRFPGAEGSAELWRLLRDGIDATREVPADRFDIDGVYDARPGTPGRLVTRRGGFLDGVDRFDAAFFGISPREAVAMDPQQRLLLEVAWEALEDAGETLERLAERTTGVFTGLITADYEHLLFRAPEALDIYSYAGASRSVVSGRISHALGFRGPSVTVDTACSSSLVAIHLACRSLRTGECDAALAGGVNLVLIPETSLGFSRAGMLSPEGRCKFGAADGDGFVRSDGAALVLLKPLASALRDGDRIYAVIRGSAVNNDGDTSWMVTPSRVGQEAVLRRAYADAGVPPGEVAYVEAHGTGTPVGDPVEIGALAAVLGEGRAEGRPCRVGSVKTNLGHTEGAAGVAGVMKAALALHHRTVPASLHHAELNPAIDWDALPLVLADETAPWPEGFDTLRAGVSSFGISGTNAHVVLEEAPAAPAAPPVEEPEPPRLLVLSARGEKALRARAAAVRDLLRAEDAPTPRDVSYVAARRRHHLEDRLAVVGASATELAEALDEFVAGRAAAGLSAARPEGVERPKVAFLFPGQGAQWVGMGRELWAAEPVFRDELERTAEAIDRYAEGWSLLDVLVRAGGERAAGLLERVDVVQPVLFAIQVALAGLWRSWGVEPAAVVGQSMGEVAAARVAGALGLDDAARIICRRSALARRHARPGAMAVVALPFEEARQALEGREDRVSVAVASGPRSTVISGDPDALGEVVAELEARDVFCRRVNVDYASHSPHMDPLESPLLEELRGIVPRRGDVPFHSTVTARRIDGEGLRPEYWWSNLRRPVLFAKTVSELARDGDWIFLEISPHPLLAAPVSQILEADGRPADAVHGSLRREEPERRAMLASLGALHVRGCAVDWAVVHPEGGWIDLPRYPWQRERFWLEEPPADGVARLGRTAAGHPLLGHHVRSPFRAGAHLWLAEIGTGRLPFLAGHRVEDAVVLPGAAFVEMALAAAHAVHGAGPTTLRRVRFEKALFLEEGRAHRVLTALEPEPGGDLRFEIFHDEDERWVKLAEGRIEARGGEAAEWDEAEEGPPPEAVAGEEHYRNMARRGLHYDREFRSVESLRRGPGIAQARIAAGASGSVYRFHPATLDGCFQALVAALPDDERAATPYLPVGIETLRVAAVPPTPLLSRARLAGGGADGVVEGRLRVVAEDGTEVLTATGLVLRPLGGDAGAEGGPEEACYFRMAWRPEERPEAGGEDGSGAWLVLGEGELAESLAGLVEARGETVFRASVAAAEAAAGPAEFDRLLREIEDRTGAGPGRVVMIAEPGARPDTGLDAEGLAAEVERSCGGLFQAIQAVQRRAPESWPRLWIVTREAQSVGGSGPSDLAASPLWGLARVLPYELPELRCSRIDLGAESEGEAAALLEEMVSGPASEEVALRPSGRWVHRLVHGPPEMGDGRDGAVAPPRRPLAAGEAYRLATTGPGVLDNLVPRRIDRQPPSAGEVEIEVRATGLNFMNVLSALGMYPGYPDGVGTLGIECSGVVAAVGPEVEGFRAGDEVLAMAPDCMASHATTDARLVAPKPRALGWEEAAALPVAFTTALHALGDLARLEEGERVLIHSATGGVGLAALQWARAAGAEILATAGSEAKREVLRELGVSAVFDSRSLDFADGVLERTGGEGVDVVLNSLAGEAMERSLALLRPYGRFVELGKRDIHAGRPVGLAPFRRSLSYFAVDLDRMMRERPARLGDLLRRVVTAYEEGRIRALPVEARDIDDVVEAFRTMAAAGHVGKLAVRQRSAGVEAVAGDARATVRADGTYLVTGGLGALGRAVAGHLVAEGAKSLALLGRSAPSDAAEEDLRDWREQGVEVEVVGCDVADPGALAAALGRLRRARPPLRGVVHAAGLLRDQMVVHADLASARRVFAPKILGAWNLHRLTADDPLDLFVLFSSAAAWIGSPGQASYAAANELLDQLALHRRARGLPATSIAWGPWSEIGLAARADRGERLALRGLGSLRPQEGVSALGRILAGDSVPRVGVMRFDVSRWTEFYPVAGDLPTLAEVRHRPPASPDEPGRPAGDERVGLDRLAGLDPDGRTTALQDHLARTVASILRLSASRLDPTLPIQKLGLDSLMAVEMKNQIQSDFGVAIPMTRILAGVSLENLAREILGGLDLPADGPA